MRQSCALLPRHFSALFSYLSQVAQSGTILLYHVSKGRATRARAERLFFRRTMGGIGSPTRLFHGLFIFWEYYMNRQGVIRLSADKEVLR
jgi:hypothetical protein